PGNRHRRWLAVPVAAPVLGTIFPPGDEANELLDGFFVGLAAFFGSGELGIAKDTRLGIAAGPGNDGRGAGGEEIDPHEGVVFVVERDGAALDLVFADIVAVEVEVERSFQLAGV